MGFGHVAWQAFPAGWVLAIEYGVLCSMVAAFIRADRVDTLFSSRATLVWLGGICLFTAGLYHDSRGHGGFLVWGGSVNGYGSFTEFLRKPSMAGLRSCYRCGQWRTGLSSYSRRSRKSWAGHGAS